MVGHHVSLESAKNWQNQRQGALAVFLIVVGFSCSSNSESAKGLLSILEAIALARGSRRTGFRRGNSISLHRSVIFDF